MQNRHAVDRLINALAATNWRQVVAVVEDEIVGYANVRLLPGWQSYVGDAYLVIGPSQRRRGLGVFLARAIVEGGAEVGVGKLLSQMLEEQAEGRQIFERVVFGREGLLVDQARDQHGRLHNLLVLAFHLHNQPEGIALPI